MISSCIDLPLQLLLHWHAVQIPYESKRGFSSTLPFAKFVEAMLLPFTPAHISNVPTLCKICGGNANAFHPWHVFQMSQHMAFSTINTLLAQFLADTTSIHSAPHMWEPCP